MSSIPKVFRIRTLVVSAVLASLVASGRPRAETIGPYEIVATPISTALSSGGGGSFTWLNVVNTPVSIQDAFTGFSVLDDGYTNAAAGTTLLMTFASGVLVNHPGPDLVLLDANNDLNVYLVSTSFDGFSHSIGVGAATDTGVDRSYFAGGAGPTSYDVYGGTIELTSLGVPPGASVDQVQVFTEGPSCDPLALGVLASPVPIPAASSYGLLTAGLLLLGAGAWFAMNRSAGPV